MVLGLSDRERSARLITGDAEELRDAIAFMQGDAGVAILDRLSHKDEIPAKSKAKTTT